MVKSSAEEPSSLAAQLANWTALNEALRTATEKGANRLLEAELRGKRRMAYLLRIHARMNVQRAKRERHELAGASA